MNTLNDILDGHTSLSNIVEAKTSSGKASLQIWYHGTSSKNLRTILKIGLDPRKNKGTGYITPGQVHTDYTDNGLEFGDNKVWDASEPAIDAQYGIYLTTNPQVAYKAARASLRKGENPVLISVLVNSRSMYADEDDVLKLIDFEPINTDEAFDIRVGKDLGLDKFERYYRTTVKKLERANFSGVSNELFMSELYNRLIKFWRQIILRSSAYYYNDLPEEEKAKYSMYFPDFSMSRVENTFRVAFESLTRFMRSLSDPRSYTNQGSEYQSGNLGRYPGAITYKGKNARIVSIIEIPEEGTAVNVYGRMPNHPYFRDRVIL